MSQNGIGEGLRLCLLPSAPAALPILPPPRLLVNSLPTQSFFSATHIHTDLKSWHPQSQKSYLATGTPELGGGDGSAGEG